MAAIADSDVIAGYTVYIDLIKHLTDDKEILTTPHETGSRPMPYGN